MREKQLQGKLGPVQIACLQSLDFRHVAAQCAMPRRDFKTNDHKKNYEKTFKHRNYSFSFGEQT